MNDVPPKQDLPDELDERYRRASGLDPSRPSESVRRAVLEHAAQLAAQRAAKSPSLIAGKIDSRRPAANRRRWRPAIFGTLAAAALAGLLITPRFLTPPAPSSAPAGAASPPLAQVSQPTAPANPPAPAPTPVVGPSRQHDVSAETSSDAAMTEGQPVGRAARAESMAKLAPRSVGGSRTELEAKPREFAGNSAPQTAAAPTPVIAAQNVAPSARSVTGARDAAAVAMPQAAAPRPPAAMPAPSPPALALARPMDTAAALRQAAEIGDMPALRALLGGQVDIDARDSGGRTALMLAILHGQSGAVDALLARGADPNAADALGTTPLQAALAGNQPAIAAALQRAGAR